MSHNDDCPTEEYARQRGREDYRSGWYSRYHYSECDDAQRAYDDGMRAERAYEQRQREAREQAEHEEMMAYEYAAQQQAKQDQYDAWCEEQFQLQAAEHYDNLFADHLIEVIDLPRWENEGGRA